MKRPAAQVARIVSWEGDWMCSCGVQNWVYCDCEGCKQQSPCRSVPRKSTAYTASMGRAPILCMGGVEGGGQKGFWEAILTFGIAGPLNSDLVVQIAHASKCPAVQLQGLDPGHLQFRPRLQVPSPRV